MKKKPAPLTREQTLQEYKTAIKEAREALDEMEKEIEEELGSQNRETND